MPSFQTALGHGIQPSLSVDVECNMTRITSVRLKREQIQLVVLDVVVGFVFGSGNRLTERHFFEERH
jgi:hypothetical protein